MTDAVEPGADSRTPRAVGVRKRYDEVPARVRSWVDDALGSPVVAVDEQVGGMSPGCATRVRTAGDRRAFFKAVGPELNPITPDLFRHEALVLTHLGADPLWAELLAVYDERDGWVALILEDVEGRHPDMADPDESAFVLEQTDLLVDRLAGCGRDLGIGTLSRSLARYEPMWPVLPELPADVLPRWCLDVADEMRRWHESLIGVAAGDHLVNYDIRNDNMLLRENGPLVFVDWGVSRTGPPWLDPLVARLEWVEQPSFDDLVHESPALLALGDDHVTAFLYTFGAWLAFRTTEAADTGLPTLDMFRRRESARMLEGARRRLDV